MRISNMAVHINVYSCIDTVAKPAVMQVMQCMTKNFPKNV